MKDTCYFERARFMLVSVDSMESMGGAVNTCEFIGGRICEEHEASAVFTGEPSGDWHIDLPRPEGLPDPKEALCVTRNFVAGPGVRWSLQYLERISARLVIGTSLSPQPILRRVWALTGQIYTGKGRVVFIGESGRGSGLCHLRDERARESMSKKVSVIDGAGSTESGMVPAVLASPAAGVLVHEVIGHFAEADDELDLSHRVGSRIASEVFEVWDDPLAEGGAAHYAVDDEGVAALGPTRVARQGQLLSLLHSLRSAARCGAVSTANGRSACCWDPPIPRVSNLICAPGQASDEELIDKMGKGLYIHSLANGFSFGNRVEAGIRLAEMVDKGKRTGRFLTGGLVDEDRFVLTRAPEISDASVFHQNSMCGKAGQVLYDVGTRAPAILVSRLNIRA